MKVTETFLLWFVLRACRGKRQRVCREREVSIANRGSFWWTAFYIMNNQLPGCLTQE